MTLIDRLVSIEARQDFAFAECTFAEEVLAAVREARLALQARPQEPVGDARLLLGELYKLVWGECSSLLNEDSGGWGELDAKIRACLDAPGPAPAEMRDGVDIHHDARTDTWVGSYKVLSAGRTPDEAVAATKSAIRLIAATGWCAGPAPAVVTQEQIEALRMAEVGRVDWVLGYNEALGDVLALYRPEAPAERAQEQKP